MFRAYIVPHLPSSVPEIQKGKYSVPDTGFFSHPEIKRWVQRYVVVPDMLNYSPYPEGGNRDSPCVSLDINPIFTQLCNQECIITCSLP
jgi:hypothetical protein